MKRLPGSRLMNNCQMFSTSRFRSKICEVSPQTFPAQSDWEYQAGEGRDCSCQWDSSWFGYKIFPGDPKCLIHQSDITCWIKLARWLTRAAPLRYVIMVLLVCSPHQEPSGPARLCGGSTVLGPMPWLGEHPGITSWQGPSFLRRFWVNFNDSSRILAHLRSAFFFSFF